MDPCAGEGEAILKISLLIGSRNRLYTCELESQRHEELKKALGWSDATHALHGDAFRIDFGASKFSCIYLNPPYDLDPIHGRLEHRFLNRFVNALDEGGVLVFVVPHYALKASADLLSREFEDLTCLAFPPEDFKAYKQIVLFARKAVSHEPDTEILAQVLAWAEDASKVPVLGTTEDRYPLRYAYVREWSIRPFDLKGLLELSKPWRSTTRLGVTVPVPHVMPENKVEDLMFREYTIATNPRPAHIAAGIASGLFNGRRVTSENPKLPDLLVKGVFDREYKTVEEKHNKDGEVTSVVQVQQPKLVTTVLDLSSRKYTTLKTSGKTKSLKIADMSIEDLLDHYGPSLMKVMSEQCPVIYDPKRDAASLPLAPISRKLFQAQEHASKALVSLLGGTVAGVNRKGKTAILLGEIGAGKSGVSLAVGRTIGNRMLVVCPPHLLQSWTNETAVNFPDAEVRVLENITDVDRIKDVPADKFLVAILSRETGKLGHSWESVTGSCPKCGAGLPEGDLAKKRACCESKHKEVQGPFVAIAQKLCLHVGKYSPKHAQSYPFIRSRFYQDLLEKRGGQELPEWSGFDSAWVAAALDTVVANILQGNAGNNAVIKLLCRLLLADYNEATIDSVIRKLKAEYPVSHEYQLSSPLRQLALLLTPGGEVQNKILADDVMATKSYSSYYQTTGLASYVKICQEGHHHSEYGTISWVDGILSFEKGEKPGSLDLAAHILSGFYGLSNRGESETECGERLFQAIPEPRRYPLSRYIVKHGKNLFDFLVLDECFVAGTLVSGRPIEEIRVGDVVDSFDEQTGKEVKRRVTRLWKNEAHNLVKLRFSNGKTLVCTPNHPIYTEKGWVPAANTVDLLVRQHEYGMDRSVQALSEVFDFGRGTGSPCREEGACLLRSDLHRSSKIPEVTALGRTLQSMWETHRDRRKTCSTGQKKRVRLLPRSLLERSFSGGRKEESRPSLEGPLSLVSERNDIDRKSWFFSSQTGTRVLQQSLLKIGEKSGYRAGQCHISEGEHPHNSTYEGQQSHAGSCGHSENGSLIKGANLPISGRKRSTYGAPDPVSQSPEVTNGSGDLHSTCSRAFPISSKLLQGGCGVLRIETGHRSGWGNPQAKKVEVLGPQEDRNFGSLRVDSVEVLERGSDGTFGGLCPDGFVYNLEVEGTHTYYAEEILVHNCHENGGSGSAQAISADRLSNLGMPTLWMTGSLMNGYASSIFNCMIAVSPDFRREFSRDERQRYIDRYGYRKRVLSEKDKETKEIVEFGSMTDRVERSERIVGDAPGILPLFLFRHLLKYSVTLHKADLAIDLPPCRQIKHLVHASPDLQKGYERLKDALVRQIKQDRFVPEKAGKLFGALSELPSYLDRASLDTGNQEDGSYEIRYPESLDRELVAQGDSFSADTLSAKEEWMLETIKAELAEGRNVMVFSWHVSLLPRMARIISEAIGAEVPVLYTEKVPTAKRQAWIDAKVVKKGHRVLIANPVGISTGLNSLVHFSTEIWMENPAVNSYILRQAIGRVDRIGAKKETRIYFPIFVNTLQENLYDLLMRKVAVAVGTDGLDPEASMAMAGIVEDGYLTGLSIGKQIWAMLND